MRFLNSQGTSGGVRVRERRIHHTRALSPVFVLVVCTDYMCVSFSSHRAASTLTTRCAHAQHADEMRDRGHLESGYASVVGIV